MILRWAISVLLLSISLSGTEIKAVLGLSEHFQDATNPDGSGLYWELIRKVYGEDSIKLDYELVPYQRAVMATRNKRADFWVASYQNEQEFAIYPRYAFDVDDVSALYQKNRLDGKLNIQSLTQNRVAWIRGYAYDKYLHVPMQKILINKRESVPKMLQSGRIDFFLDDQSEMEIAFSRQQLESAKLTHSPLFQLKLYLAFQNSERGKKLAEIWDRNFLKLHQDGRLKKLYDRYRDYTLYYPF